MAGQAAAHRDVPRSAAGFIPATLTDYVGIRNPPPPIALDLPGQVATIGGPEDDREDPTPRPEVPR